MCHTSNHGEHSWKAYVISRFMCYLKKMSKLTCHQVKCCRFSLHFSMTDSRGGTLLTYWSGIDSVSQKTIHLSGFYLMNGTNKQRSMTWRAIALQDGAWSCETQGPIQPAGKRHRDGTVKATVLRKPRNGADLAEGSVLSLYRQLHSGLSITTSV